MTDERTRVSSTPSVTTDKLAYKPGGYDSCVGNGVKDDPSKDGKVSALPCFEDKQIAKTYTLNGGDIANGKNTLAFC